MRQQAWSHLGAQRAPQGAVGLFHDLGRQLELGVEAIHTRLQREIMSWVEVFGEDVDISGLLKIVSLRTDTGNSAGIDIPVFEGIDFDVLPYDLFVLPPWVDRGIDAVKKLLALDAELRILKEQHRLLSEELRITTQRVNLFEKVKIPETKESIRMIRIYLGDQQTAAVVRGKIAKSAIAEKVSQQERSA